MIGIRTKSRILALLAFSVMAIAACSSGGGEGDLVDREWNLAEYGAAGITTATVGNPTINFDSGAGTFSGSTGCNTFSGNYSIDGDSLSLTSISVTEKACPEPAGVMEQEGTYLRHLNGALSFSFGDDEMRIRTSQGGLIFRK